MILYLDTSSLLKLFLAEVHSDLVAQWAEAAEAIATSQVAYPEAMSALARRWSQGDLTGEELAVARERLDGAWPTYVLLQVNERMAGELAGDFLLRGFDAIHLAAAYDLRSRFPSEDLVFSSFDTDLIRAAGLIGLATLHLTPQDGYVMDPKYYAR